MKTLVLEPDPMRARGWTALYGEAAGVVHVARSPAQARLMLISGGYDRLCLRMQAQGGASHALLSVAHAVNPECEIVDLASQRSRRADGPMAEAAEEPAPYLP